MAPPPHGHPLPGRHARGSCPDGFISAVGAISAAVTEGVHPAAKAASVLGYPSSDASVVVACAKPHEPGVRVVESSRESKWDPHVSGGQYGCESVGFIYKLVEAYWLGHVFRHPNHDGARGPGVLAHHAGS